MTQHFDPQAIARAMEALESETERPARFIIKVTTRQARTICFMRGPMICEARKAPVWHRGLWLRVID